VVRGNASAGGSFNGRTTDSDSVNRGSNPRLPAIINTKGCGCYSFAALSFL
jgi:hypothetical protein